MAEYNPSKIIKDGNTYNFRDDTKIPLAGSNAISGSLIPATTNDYDLGGSQYQWNNAYIKSLTINGVACGDILTHNASEFVDVTTAQTIGGAKTFSNIIYTSGQQIIIKSNNVERTVLPASIVYMSYSFNDKSAAGVASRFSAVENVVKTNGDINLILRAYDFSTKSNAKSSVVMERKYDGTSNFYPEVSNDVNLGTSINKWKSFNGIAPDELGLPTSTYTDVSSYITNLDGVTPNRFTAPASGILYFEGNNSTVLYNLFYVNSVPIDNSSHRCTIPVTKGDNVTIWTRASQLGNIRIYHLKGKV